MGITADDRKAGCKVTMRVSPDQEGPHNHLKAKK